MAETREILDVNEDLESENPNSSNSPARKNIPLKLKGKGRGRGRSRGRGRKSTPRKSVAAAILEDEEEEGVTEGQTEEIDLGLCISSEKTFDIDDDISKLETPTFTTLERGPPEPLHQNKKLKWGHKVNLIGEKVVNPMIHCCEKCSFPILIYGRMIPCKHVFCLECAKKCGKTCHRCKDKVTRVEQSALGTVFTCTFGGARHSVGGCKRTYLSQRDLQAHINHRHLRQAISTSASTSTTTTSTTSHSHPLNPANPTTHIVNIRDPRNHLVHASEALVSQTVSQASHTPPPHLQQGHTPPSSHSMAHMHHLPDYRDIQGGGVLVVNQDQRSTSMLPPQHHPLPPMPQMVPVSAGGPPLIAQTPPSQQRTSHSYPHPSPNQPPQGHPPPGHPPPGHPPQGHPPPGHPPQGHPPPGHPPQGHPPSGHPPQGHPPPGHPPQGHPPPGHPPQGHPPPGHPSQGHPPPGHPSQGHPPPGHPSQGHPPQGHPTQTHPPPGHPPQGHPPPGHLPPGHPQYPSPIPVVSNRSNLITVPIQDDSSSSPHLGVHSYKAHSPQSHQSQPPPPQQGAMPQQGQHQYQQPPPSHHYSQQAPPYSQPPSMGQQNFNQPPPSHLPPPPIVHSPGPNMFSGPPHHPPPNYNPGQIRPHQIPRPPMPQRFPQNSYDEPHYVSNWGGQGPRPPPAHGNMPPRGMPHGPGGEGFRPPYYS